MNNRLRQRVTFGLLATIAVLFILFFFASVQARGWFDYAGVDYRVYWASAQIARMRGFSAVYDLNQQTDFQRAVYQQYARQANQTPVQAIELPYLPIFIALFLPFGLVDPLPSFILWSVADGIIFLIYLRRLFKESQTSFDPFLVAACVLGVPFLFNFFFGQIDIILLIALGEALIAWGRGKELTAGAWLAGLLLKPQLLILILPGLLLQRKWRALAGFTLLSIILGLVSLLLAGVDGMMAWVRLLISFAQPQGLSTNFTESMMSWRAVALNWDSVISLKVGWEIALVGMGLTAMAGLGLWFYVREPTQYLWIWLGTTAATFTVAWHSHVHTALLLLAPIILGWKQFRSMRIVWWWLILPSMAFLGIVWIYTPLVLAMDSSATLIGPAFGHIVLGTVMLVLNLVILTNVWRALRQTRRKSIYAVQ